MGSRATKHINLYMMAFDTYEVISPRKVHLGDDSVAKAIGMGSIVIGVETKGKTSTIHITYVLHVSKL